MKRPAVAPAEGSRLRHRGIVCGLSVSPLSLAALSLSSDSGWWKVLRNKNTEFLESRLSGRNHEAVTGLCRSSASSSVAYERPAKPEPKMQHSDPSSRKCRLNPVVAHDGPISRSHEVTSGKTDVAGTISGLIDSQPIHWLFASHRRLLAAAAHGRGNT